MNDDTLIGGPKDRFPPTRHSAIAELASDDHVLRERALGAIVEAYWKPVYKYVRIKWNRDNESAKDLTQSFFLRLIEKDFLKPFDPGRARFRTFLRTCLDRFIMNEDQANSRLKRGGNIHFVSADFGAAEAELADVTGPVGHQPDDVFEREWIRHLLSLAVAELQDHCQRAGKDIHFRMFERYDLGRDPRRADGGAPVGDGARRVTYGDLAAEHDITVDTVTNYLAYARREFRRLVLERIRAMTVSEREFREEVRTILGIDGAEASP